ncbi:MAG: hypothetical protein KJO07_20885 [Deltaproteobacteria bacterium]|nr:hypothetical protein [Deltaproteobacteria bacterium]
MRSSHRPRLSLRASHRRSGNDWTPPDKDSDTPWEATPATGKQARKKAKRKKKKRGA